MKPFWRSKTVLLNAGALVALILTQFVADGEALGIPPDVLKWAAFALTVLNIVLRFYTKEAVTMKPEQEG